ncbi:hypothetical protein [Chamaesiphon sp. OTE_75_metabat_556]|uniref:hypothetical protein n=1 Tax=Chamaesiphon sp. OTE_75_metabat_556 TaxID=2964692 RepID=UPI00286B9572|nr:hypothetical protein [Chamaesiphon sp. OTE_75_metabat_556]
MKFSSSIVRSIFVSIVLTTISIASTAKPSSAFDTGHHFDLTRDAMQDQGLGNTAIEVAQLENWLVDYYSNPKISPIKDDVNLLHFDNLLTPQQVRNYWGRFTVNTRDAVHQATRERNPLKLLTIMGISLHAVQDFYTHSDWAEQHPPTGNSYRTETWYNSSTKNINVITAIAGHFQGTPPPNHPKHGGYDSGLNKDSYNRPNWDRSYVFAYAGSREWVNAIKTWVNEIDPNFWTTVKSFSVSGSDRQKLDRDLTAVYRISEWVKDGSDDGHWKGRGSGSRGEFLAFSASWIARPDGRFVSEFKDKKTYLLLNKGLAVNAPSPVAIPVVPRLPINHRAVLVRTLKVAEKDDVGTFETKIDPFGKADFYAKIMVAGQEFVEAMQIDRSSRTPDWMTIKFIPNTLVTVPIRYQLWDEDGVGRGDDELVDINPSKDIRALNFSLNVSNHSLSGDLMGVFDREANPVNITGKKPDSDRGVLQFYVTERPLNAIRVSAIDVGPVRLGPVTP